MIDVGALKTDDFQKFIDIGRVFYLVYIEQATGNQVTHQSIEENGEADTEDDAEDN